MKALRVVTAICPDSSILGLCLTFSSTQQQPSVLLSRPLASSPANMTSAIFIVIMTALRLLQGPAETLKLSLTNFSMNLFRSVGNREVYLPIVVRNVRLFNRFSELSFNPFSFTLFQNHESYSEVIGSPQSSANRRAHCSRMIRGPTDRPSACSTMSASSGVGW